MNKTGAYICIAPVPQKEKVTLIIFVLFAVQNQGTANYNVKFNQIECEA